MVGALHVIPQLLRFSELSPTAREHGSELGRAVRRTHVVCQGLAVVELHSAAFVVRQRLRRDWAFY